MTTEEMHALLKKIIDGNATSEEVDQACKLIHTNAQFFQLVWKTKPKEEWLKDLKERENEPGPSKEFDDRFWQRWDRVKIANKFPLNDN